VEASQADASPSRLSPPVPREPASAPAAAVGRVLPTPPHPTLTEAFAGAAGARPDSAAVVCGGVSCSYSELDRRARAIESRLRGAGVRRGDRAAIFLDRSIDMVAAVLAVLRCGAAYVPIDPDYPAARIALMLEDSGAVAVATRAALAARLPVIPASILLVDGAREAAAPAAEGPQAADLAYVLYTSGSTGKPKGVAVEHRSVLNLLESMRREPGFDSSVVWLAVTTLSFDIAGLELFLPLTAGGRIVLATREEALDGKALAGLIEAHGANCLQATPTIWRLLLDAGWKAPPGFTALCGGETVPRPLAEEIMARGARLWNAYGPTETTIWSTLEEVVSGAGPLLVGRPVGGTVIRILGDDLRPLPAGEAGEVCIGGAGVARGYWNRPELTAERFIADPVAGGDARLYRTGDRGLLLTDGRLRLLGRSDDQVKIRGLRVELGEVEAALAAHRAVAAAAAAVRDDGKGPRLAAYWVARAGASASARELCDFVSRGLPPHMIPAAFTRLESLPLTPNGKIDRRALPAPEGGRLRPEAAETPLQRRIRQVWEDLLGISPIGLDDDFFALGGHSLLAVQMLAKVETIAGRRPPLAALYRRPTIAHLAEELSAQAPLTDEIVRLGPMEGRSPFFFLHGDPCGAGLYCRGLAKEMPDRPFYALAPSAPSGFGELPGVEELARRHVKAIRALRPCGPYLLGGYWLAGVVAFEAARQLEAAGERVASLVLFDIPADNRCWRLARRAAGMLGGALKLDQPALLKHFYLWGRFCEPLARLSFGRRATNLIAAVGLPRAQSSSPSSEVSDVTRSLLWAWSDYRAAPFGGALSFLETTDVYVAGKPIDSALRRLNPGAAQVFLKDNDKTMMTARVSELGAEMARILAAAEADGRTS